MYESIHTAPSPPPPWADTRALAFFFALDGKFTGVGTLELSNPPGWERKKRANTPAVLRQHCNIFHGLHG